MDIRYFENEKGKYAIFNGKEYKFNGERYGGLHRSVYEYHNGEIPKGYSIHHVNHDPLDNRIENLIMLTHSEHISLHNRDKKNMLGKKHSAETRKKMSENNVGMLGKNHTQEARKKMSEARKGCNHPMYGKKHTQESRNKISESCKGKSHTKEVRKKMSEARKGTNNPMYGKKCSEETRKKISEALKGSNHPQYIQATQEMVDDISNGIKLKDFKEKYQVSQRVWDRLRKELLD